MKTYTKGKNREYYYSSLLKKKRRGVTFMLFEFFILGMLAGICLFTGNFLLVFLTLLWSIVFFTIDIAPVIITGTLPKTKKKILISKN